MKTFPNLTLNRFLRWASIRNIRRVRPLYWMDYRKEEAKAFLTSEMSWEWYGGHHLENRFTAFYHGYFLPRRWGIDGRLLEHSALVRSGQMARSDAIQRLTTPPDVDPEILGLVKKRLGFSDAEFEALMTGPKHHYTEFRTYKHTFERLRPLLWLLYKADRLPKSFYVKFAHPDSSGQTEEVVRTREPQIQTSPEAHRAD
jgi:hypothetical protein